MTTDVVIINIVLLQSLDKFWWSKGLKYFKIYFFQYKIITQMDEMVSEKDFKKHDNMVNNNNNKNNYHNDVSNKKKQEE